MADLLPECQISVSGVGINNVVPSFVTLKVSDPPWGLLYLEKSEEDFIQARRSVEPLM